jgi:hypothetical protein
MADAEEEDIAEEELPDEIFGNLRLKRAKNETGYMYVTRPGKSKKKPYQARIKNKRTGKTQHLGSFASAHLAARAVASALATNEDKDMQSPRKQAQRGAWHPHPLPHMQHVMTRAHATRTSQAA